MQRIACVCADCGKVFEKTAYQPSEVEMGQTMVSYLARRHREKTGHATTPITTDPPPVLS